jgi:hypothetical protein
MPHSAEFTGPGTSRVLKFVFPILPLSRDREAARAVISKTRSMLLVRYGRDHLATRASVSAFVSLMTSGMDCRRVLPYLPSFNLAFFALVACWKKDLLWSCFTVGTWRKGDAGYAKNVAGGSDGDGERTRKGERGEDEKLGEGNHVYGG